MSYIAMSSTCDTICDYVLSIKDNLSNLSSLKNIERLVDKDTLQLYEEVLDSIDRESSCTESHLFNNAIDSLGYYSINEFVNDLKTLKEALEVCE